MLSVGNTEPRMDINTGHDPEQAAHSIQRLIGRNLLLSQRLEQLLKVFVSEGKIEGYIDELEGIRTKQKERTNKMTMGSLIGEYVENSVRPAQSDEKEEARATAPLRTMYFSMSLGIECDEERHASIKASMKELVDERNELVHHFLRRYNPECPQATKDAELWLEQQGKRLRSEVESLQRMGQAMIEARKLYGELLQSDEVCALLFPAPNIEGPVIDLLESMTCESDKADHWVPLNSAGKQLWYELPEEMANLKPKYGHSKLKALVEASDLFELKQLDNGQWLYRIDTRTKVQHYSICRQPKPADNK